jgi:hypothetical protein
VVREAVPEAMENIVALKRLSKRHTGNVSMHSYNIPQAFERMRFHSITHLLCVAPKRRMHISDVIGISDDSMQRIA